MPENRFEWGAEAIALLGGVSDSALAEQLGISRHAVRYKRIALGIPAWRYSAGVFWTPERIALLGKESDLVIAFRFGLTKNAVARMREKKKVPLLRDRKSVV